MAQHRPSPLDPDEDGEYVPNLSDRLPELLAEELGGEAEDYEGDDYPMPDPLEDKPIDDGGS